MSIISGIFIVPVFHVERAPHRSVFRICGRHKGEGPFLSAGRMKIRPGQLHCFTEYVNLNKETGAAKQRPRGRRMTFHGRDGGKSP